MSYSARRSFGLGLPLLPQAPTGYSAGWSAGRVSQSSRSDDRGRALATQAILARKPWNGQTFLGALARAATGYNDSQPVDFPAEIASDPPNEPNKYHQQRVFFLLQELSKNDDFISKLSFGSQVRFGVVSATAFGMAREVVDAGLVQAQQSESSKPGSAEDQLRAKFRQAQREVYDAFEKGEQAVAPYLEMAKSVPGGQELISAIQGVVTTAAADTMRMSSELLDAVKESGVVPILGDVFKLVMSIVDLINQTKAEELEELRRKIDETYQRTKLEADRLKRMCVDANVEVGSRGGQTFPSDIFEPYQGKSGMVVPDIGVALMAVASPDASDLEAVRLINERVDEWIATDRIRRNGYVTSESASDPLRGFSDFFPAWLSRRPILYPQPTSVRRKDSKTVVYEDYEIAPWDFEEAGKRIKSGDFTKNFETYRSLWAVFPKGSRTMSYHCAGGPHGLCEMREYNGMYGGFADRYKKTFSAELKRRGFPLLSQEIFDGLAVRVGPAPQGDVIGRGRRFTPTVDNPVSPEGVRFRWPDPILRPTTRWSRPIRGSENADRIVYDVSPRTRSLFRMMHRLILEEARGQGNKGRDIMPYFLDLLLYELNSGRITDGAITAILARHFPCWDVNQSSRDSLYRMLIDWQQSNIVRTPEQAQDRATVRSQLQDLSEKLVSDPKSLVGNPLVPPTVLDKYIQAYDRREANSVRRAESVTQALLAKRKGKTGAQILSDALSGKTKAETKPAEGGIPTWAVIAAVAAVGGGAFFLAKKYQGKAT